TARGRRGMGGPRGGAGGARRRRPGLPARAGAAGGGFFEPPPEEPFGPSVPAPLDHLIDCVETGRAPAASIQEARRSFLVALAAYESARKGLPVVPKG